MPPHAPDSPSKSDSDKRNPHEPIDTPRFLLVTDEARFPNPLPLIEALPAHAGVIFRHYQHAERERLGGEVAALCRARRLPLLVAGDIRLAIKLKAQGVHLPQWMWERHGMVRRPYDGFLITAAAHSKVALAKASRMGFDGVLLSPVFATASHPDAETLGVIRLAAWSYRYGGEVSIYALGGMAREARQRLRGCRLAGAAATSF